MSSPASATARELLRTREQEDHVTALISLALALADDLGTAVDPASARVIAATLHAGCGTALERFAATGMVDAATALSEIDECRREAARWSWVAALWDFLERLPAEQSTMSPEVA